MRRAVFGRTAWRVGICSDYRRELWKMTWRELRQGNVESVFQIAMVGHHLITFGRECLSRDVQVSAYSARRREEDALLGGFFRTLPRQRDSHYRRLRSLRDSKRAVKDSDAAQDTLSFPLQIRTYVRESLSATKAVEFEIESEDMFLQDQEEQV